jgi:hypothetical protein
MCNGERGKHPPLELVPLDSPLGDLQYGSTDMGEAQPSELAPLHSGCTTAGSRHQQNENAHIVDCEMWLCEITFFTFLYLSPLYASNTYHMKLYWHMCVYICVTEHIIFQEIITALSTACIDALRTGMKDPPVARQR